MNDAQAARDISDPIRDERLSGLFAHLVLQQSNMAMMLLGKVPHPETGQVVRDLEAAQVFVEMLDMLEAKTKGNLTRDEQALLKQSLMAARLAFVESVDAPAAEPAPSAGATPAPEAPAAPLQTPPSEEEHRKKFSKKY